MQNCIKLMLKTEIKMYAKLLLLGFLNQDNFLLNEMYHNINYIEGTDLCNTHKLAFYFWLEAGL